MKKYILRQKNMIIGMTAGAILGYMYYYFIGCSSGSCPITSNPWVSTLYGAGMGAVGLYGGGRKEKG